jgi:hypothetical protein
MRTRQAISNSTEKCKASKVRTGGGASKGEPIYRSGVVFESLRSRSLGIAVDDCWNAALGLGRSWPKPFLTTFAHAHQTVCVA